MNWRTMLPGRTIGEGFAPRDNSLNALRLLLAALVIVSHSITIGGFGSEYIVGHATLGDVAVDGFFGISGFLIAGSAVRHGTLRFLWMRILRIFPAFWLCLVVVGFGFASIGWVHLHSQLHGFLTAPLGPFRYVLANVGLHMSQYQVAGTPGQVPYPLAWNGSLWTLEWEFYCYLGMALLAATRILRSRQVVMMLAGVVWLAELAAYVHPSTLTNHSFVEFGLRFASIFLAGSVLYLFREKVPDSGWLALLSVALMGIGMTLANPNVITGPALAYVLIWLGMHVPLQRLGARNDISYGVYIYAFPVQQLLATWDIQRFGYVAFTACALLATIPLAMGSWFGIERRSLLLKSWTPRASVPRVSTN